MSDLVSTVGTAISIAKRLREISKNIEDAEFKNLLADLSLELAEVKMTMAGVMQENTDLRVKIVELESLDGDPCPKCRKRSWELIGSEKDKTFGDLGGILRHYECSECGFAEDSLYTPS